MMKSVTGQQGDRDRFIEHLKVSEGVEYETIGEDVKTRFGNNDFDYLLRSSSGELLALEITWLTESDRKLMADSMRQKIRQSLEPLLLTEKLPGMIAVDIPWNSQFSKGQSVTLLREKSETISEQIIQAARNLAKGDDEVIVITDLGALKVSKFGDEKGIIFSSFSVGAWPFGNYGSALTYFKEIIVELIPKKNQQLDFEADKRVLLIGNACPIASNDAITDAISDFVRHSPSELTNINEIYVDFGINQFRRLYPSDSSRLSI